MGDAPIEIRDVVFVHGLRLPHLVAWHSRWHRHSPGELELHYFLGGSGSFKQASRVHAIERGTLFFSPSETEHAIQAHDLTDPLTYYAILFVVDPESELANVVGNPRFASSFPGKIGMRRRVRFEEIKNRYVHENASYRAAAGHDLASFLYDLFAGITVKRRLPVSTDENSIHVERLLALFQRNLENPLKLGDFASEVGVSREHLIRLFRAQFGVTPMAYYRRLRLEAATSLLLNTTNSVKEIAWSVGFANQFQFSAAFKDYSGVSPSAYRDQYFHSNPTEYGVRILPV